MKIPTEPLKIHFGYVVCIFVLILIWIASLVFLDDASVLSHISLASSLTSLILAIVAIFYSYISDSSVSSSLGKISQSADQLTETTRSLTNINDLLEKHFSIFDEKINTRMDSGFSDMGEKILSFATQFTAVVPQSYSGPLITSGRVTEMISDQSRSPLDFLNKVALSGTYTFYVLVKAHEKEIPFPFDLLPRDQYRDYFSGLFAGYQNMAISLGYITSRKSPNNASVSIEYVEPEFAQQVVGIKQAQMNQIANNEQYNFMRELFEKADEYFNSQPNRK